MSYSFALPAIIPSLVPLIGTVLARLPRYRLRFITDTLPAVGSRLEISIRAAIPLLNDIALGTAIGPLVGNAVITGLHSTPRALAVDLREGGLGLGQEGQGE